jgi:hypothetical protein
MNPERLARIVFRGAGIYGLMALLPQYFLERRIGADTPPPITHPEYFYGFLGIAIAWQVLFLTIASHPVPLRPVIPAAILEKLSFGIAVWVLYGQGRVLPLTVFFGSIDLLLGVLFYVVYVRLGKTYFFFS